MTKRGLAHHPGLRLGVLRRFLNDSLCHRFFGHFSFSSTDRAHLGRSIRTGCDQSWAQLPKGPKGNLLPSVGSSAGFQLLPSPPVGTLAISAPHRALLRRGAAAPQGLWAKEACLSGGRRGRLSEAGPQGQGADTAAPPGPLITRRALRSDSVVAAGLVSASAWPVPAQLESTDTGSPRPSSAEGGGSPRAPAALRNLGDSRLHYNSHLVYNAKQMHLLRESTSWAGVGALSIEPLS